MQLSELESVMSVIHIRGKEYRTKFSLNCLLCLERMYKALPELLEVDYEKWSVEDVLQLTRAALCDLPENKEAVRDRVFEAVRPDIAELGMMIEAADLPLLRAELMLAISRSFKAGGASADAEDEQHRYYTGYGHLRAYYCDVMGRPDEEFWGSCRREIDNRVDWYMETKGIKEKAIIVKEFDD